MTDLPVLICRGQNPCLQENKHHTSAEVPWQYNELLSYLLA
nr:MAG TPA: hypothetical protein [Caudoviricetes sp.]